MMQIHPTVIMSISEHHTRTRAIRQQPEVVIGVLLGKKSDQSVEIVDSFELACSKTAADELLLDTEFWQKKIPLVKQVFSDLELIGWYATTPPPTSVEANVSDALAIALHRQVNEFIPNAIFVRLNPYQRESDPKISESLPLQVFESAPPANVTDLRPNLVEVAWTVVSEEVEIIGLEHNAKMTDHEVPPSAAVDNLRLQYSAVKQLKDRIKVISKYIKDVQSGSLPYSEDTLNEIQKLSRRFPLMNSEAYIKAYNVQGNDVALNTYLGVLTKGSMSRINSGGSSSSKMRGFGATHARR